MQLSVWSVCMSIMSIYQARPMYGSIYQAIVVWTHRDNGGSGLCSYGLIATMEGLACVRMMIYEYDLCSLALVLSTTSDDWYKQHPGSIPSCSLQRYMVELNNYGSEHWLLCVILHWLLCVILLRWSWSTASGHWYHKHVMEHDAELVCLTNKTQKLKTNSAEHRKTPA